MRVFIDCDLDLQGRPVTWHWLDTDVRIDNKVESHLNPGLIVDVSVALQELSTNPALRDAAGWNAVSKVPGLPAGTTRWQAMLNQVNGLLADPAAKALQLK